MRKIFALLSVMLLSFIPHTSAQIDNPDESTETSLYLHIFDTFNRFPINVQPMNAEFFEVGGTNFPSMETAGFDFNTIYGYSTAGPVEYEFIENGRPRTHPERGIAADVEIDDAVQPVGYLYVDVRDFLGLDELPNTLPSFTMAITMREGDNFGDVEKLNEGAIIMQGEVTAHVADTTTCDIVTGSTCTSDGNEALRGQSMPDGTPIFIPDESGIIEFAIPLELEQDRINKVNAFNVRIDWYQNPTGDESQDDQFSEGYFRLIADTDHLPRMVFNIMNPIYVEYVHPQVSGNVLLIHTGINSPWGTYDIDQDNITLSIDGPTTPVSIQKVVTANTHRHGAHDQAAEVTYLWNFRDDNAEKGEYKISLSVSNLNQTATAIGEATFTIEGKKAFATDDQGEIVEPTEGESGGDKESPGIAPFALILALLGIAQIIKTRKGGKQ